MPGALHDFRPLLRWPASGERTFDPAFGAAAGL
jgi:hypothetical protein